MWPYDEKSAALIDKVAVCCLQYVPQFVATAFDSKFACVRTQLHKPRVYVNHAHVFLHKQWIMAAVHWGRSIFHLYIRTYSYTYWFKIADQ